MMLKCSNGHDLSGRNLPVDDVGIEYCPVCGSEELHDYNDCQYCGAEYAVDREEAFPGCCMDCYTRAREDLMDFLKGRRDLSHWARTLMADALPHMELEGI